MDYSKIRGGHGRPTLIHTPKPKKAPKYPQKDYDYTPISQLRDCPECGGLDSMERGRCRMCGWPHKS